MIVCLCREAPWHWHRHHPNRKMFVAIDYWSGGPGRFKPSAVNWGRESSIQRPDVEEGVLDCIEENPGVSMRQIGTDLNAAQMTMWRVLHEPLLYPYHLQHIQLSSTRDPLSLVCSTVCRTSLLFSECYFQMRQVFVGMASIVHNHYQWAEDNLHGVLESRHRQQFSINIWASIVGELVGLCGLPMTTATLSC